MRSRTLPIFNQETICLSEDWTKKLIYKSAGEGRVREVMVSGEGRTPEFDGDAETTEQGNRRGETGGA